MKVLGISYGYHDSSATLVENGEVIVSVTEASFSRQKHDPAFPRYAIDHCLSFAKTPIDSIDRIVFHEDPHLKFSRVLTSSLAPYPTSRNEFVNSVKAWLGKKLWAIPEISLRMGVPSEKISYLSHHFSHAVQAFMGSGFEESAVLVVDAVGDWSSTALYCGAWDNGKPKVERILEIPYPNSLGLVYSAFTAYLGFSPNDSECSTMALAAFGKPVYAKEVRKMIQCQADGLYEVDQSYFNFANFYRGAVTEKFTDLLGPARKQSDVLPFSAWGNFGEVSKEAQRFADIASSVQTVLEDCLIALSRKLHSLCPSNNLCFAGGVALNCVLNYKLLKEAVFKNVHIPPDPGDGGTSIGTALYYSAVQGTGNSKAAPYGPYLGSDGGDMDVAFLDYIRQEKIAPYLMDGVSQRPNARWRHETFESEAVLIDKVVAVLMKDGIVGWFQGRGEIGPRALGHRSLLIRPDKIDVAKRMSALVKERALYRPYALSMTPEAASEILDLPDDLIRFQRWMQYGIPVREEKWANVQGGIHIDGTTRPQVCFESENPRFHKLLTAFGEKFGLGTLVNTSFNPSKYPIVSTPIEALLQFARTDMDALVLNNTLVWRE